MIKYNSNLKKQAKKYKTIKLKEMKPKKRKYFILILYCHLYFLYFTLFLAILLPRVCKLIFLSFI